jgi:hypothetical protein
MVQIPTPLLIERKKSSFSADDVLPKVEEGSFVYQVVRTDGVIVREHPYSFATATNAADAFSHHEDEDDDDDDEEDDIEEYIFQLQELVEVDQVVTHAGNSLLRLADHTGWLAAEWQGQVAMKRLECKTGLWSWYVDNYPVGITVRRHPLDSADLLPTERQQHQHLQRLWPFQKIYCDRQVVHPVTGVTFYRLQSCSMGNASNSNLSRSIKPMLSTMVSATSTSLGDESTNAATVQTLTMTMMTTMAATVPSLGWVYDRTPASKDGQDLFWLLEESMIQRGKLWVYRSLHEDLVIRKVPNIAWNMRRDDELRLPHGDMVAVHQIRTSPYSQGNGPFLQLTDGSGWLFESRNGSAVMEQVPVETGHWECKVLNAPVGVGLRRHPMDGQEQLFGNVVFPYESVLQCDAKVTNPDTKVSHYRVQGTDGWVFDRRDEMEMLEVLSWSSVPKHQQQQQPNDGWSPDFVRGIAATVEGLQEKAYYPHSRVVSFQIGGSMEIHVFLSTRTVTRAIDHPGLHRKVHSSQRNCTPKDLLAFFRKDAIELFALSQDDDENKEEKKEEAEQVEKNEGWTMIEREEELRHELLRVDAEISQLLAKRRKVLQQVTLFDEQRAKEARQTTNKSPAIPQVETDFASRDDDDDDDSSHSSGSSSHSSGSQNSAGISGIIAGVRSFRMNGSSNSNVTDGISHAASDISNKTGSTSLIASAATAAATAAVDDNVEVALSRRLSPRSLRSPRTSVMTEDGDAVNISTASHSRKEVECMECGRIFNGKYSRDIHCKKAHNLFCPMCDKIFPSRAELENHRHKEEHW